MESWNDPTNILGVPLPYGCGVVTVRWLSHKICYSHFEPMRNRAEVSETLQNSHLFRFGFDLQNEEDVHFSVSWSRFKEFYAKEKIVGMAASLTKGYQENTGPIAFDSIDEAATYLAEMIITTHTVGPYVAAIMQREGKKWETSVDVFRESNIALGTVAKESDFITESLLSSLLAHA